ncbi:MAG: hypothetical protein FWH49_02685, partial [Clostridiales bacterium]|nr:hypothetical protein [Clostridiales bacterium]
MSGKKTKAARKAGTRPDKQQAKSKIIAKKKTSKKVFWISFTLCVLVIVVIAVISFINRDTSSNDTAGAELFPYSEGIDESGFWKDTAALDHV